jgi:hypothetical protein
MYHLSESAHDERHAEAERLFLLCEIISDALFPRLSTDFLSSLGSLFINHLPLLMIPSAFCSTGSPGTRLMRKK